MERLGKNIGGYLGETIDIPAVLRDIEIAAQRHTWTLEVFYQTPEFKLLALHRAAHEEENQRRIYISAGIHGDEPAGPLAALRLLQENRWPANAELWLLPCLNPTGLVLNSRGNTNGTDLNRDYRHFTTAQVRAHVQWFECQPKFDLCLLLHEDWESHGFYLYEQNPDNQPSLAETMVEAVANVCPVDQSELIEGRPAKHGIVRPNIDPHSRPDWPEAFYIITHKSRLSYTLEAPSDFPLQTRVDALVAGVNAALRFGAPSTASA